MAVWDLRKLKSVKTFAAAECGGAATAVDFDLSGAYLAVGTGAGAVRVFGTKEWNAVATLEAGAANGGSVTGVKFGAHASFVAAASSSAQLRVWGTDAMQP